MTNELTINYIHVMIAVLSENGITVFFFVGLFLENLHEKILCRQNIQSIKLM